jgi:hypothetical protein
MCYIAIMPSHVGSTAAPFTSHERALIRREFSQHFGSFPSLAEGIFLRTWRGGPQAGEPKLPPAVRTMLERGLVEVRQDGRLVRAHFTMAGIEALRDLASDRRHLDPVRFAHLRRELGLNVEEDSAASAE